MVNNHWGRWYYEYCNETFVDYDEPFDYTDGGMEHLL